MKIGLLPSPYHGHLNPMCTIGRELKGRGHEIVVFSVEDVRKKVESEGLEFLPYGEKEFPSGYWESVWSPREARAEGFHGLLNTAANLYRLVGIMCRDIAPAAKSAGVELLLIDQVHFQGKSIAKHVGVPYINICCALNMNEEGDGTVPPPFSPQAALATTPLGKLKNRLGFRFIDLLAYPSLLRMRRYCSEWGVDKAESLQHSYSSLAQICPMVPEFDFPRSLPNTFHYVGPYLDSQRMEPELDFEIVADKPLVYASLGTVKNYRMDIFEKIAEACSSMEVQLVVSLGDWHQRKALPKLKGNPIVRRFIPQLSILKRASLTITHAGMNTVLESLAFGVPMVAIPITNDQPAVAARIRYREVGQVLSPQQLSLEALRGAVSEVLSDPKYKSNAQQIQASIKTHGGVHAAADLIEKLLKA